MNKSETIESILKRWKNESFSDCLRRSTPECRKRLVAKSDSQPYHRFEIPPPCVSRGDVSNWNGW